MIHGYITRIENFSFLFSGLEVSSLKIVSIGTNSYLALISIDYLDKLTDKEIVNLNKELINEIQDVDSSVSEIYFNPK